MRLTPRARTTLGGLASHGTGWLRVPSVEAIPPELVCRANLVGEAEGIHPAFLFRPPPAIPCELDDAGLPASLDDCGADEIGAPRPRIHLQPIDHPFRVGVQQLTDEADHLDTRDVPHEGDGRHVGARREGDDVVLEAVGRAGARQDFGVDRHGRNISGRWQRLGAANPATMTKLTAESARHAQGGFWQW